MTALSGIRVLDLAGESGVFATRILADLGAEVLRPEPPGGDRVRRLAPFLHDRPGLERSIYHLFHNAGKQSILLDPDAPDGLERLRTLAAESDVLVETGRPGEATARGLGFEPLAARNPGLIYVSITPFGQTGLRHAWRANDLVAAAAGGLLSVTGEVEDPPAQSGADQAYKMAGLAAATACLVALTGRRIDPSHRGAHLDISVQEAVMMAMVQVANPNLHTWHGFVPRRPGMTDVYQCADGHWAVCVPRPDRIKLFVQWVRDAGFETDLTVESWRASTPRGAVWPPEVTRLVTLLAATLPRDEFLKQAWQRDMLGLPVNSFPNLLTCDHLVETRQFLDVEDEARGLQLSYPRSPVDALGDVQLRRAPMLGEHTAPPERPSEAAPAAAAGPREAPRPLQGIRVVDFCWVLAGPLGTRILANFGADVIKMESQARPDTSRGGPGPNGERSFNVGAMHNDVNTGKRSVTLDVSRPEGRLLAQRLVMTADVVTNNFRPGALERMGFGYGELRRLKPDIIVLNLPGYGSSGPWSGFGAFGNLILAASGLSHITGFPGRRPRGMGLAYADFTSPYLLATCVLAALHERDRTGLGREIDLSQLSAMVSLLGVEWLQFSTGGEPPGPQSNRKPGYAPHGVYATAGADRWLALAVEGDEQWRAMVQLIGRPELEADPRFTTHAVRKANEDALDAAVSAWTSPREEQALAEQLQACGIAAAPVADLHDLLMQDPPERPHYQRVRQPSDPAVEITIDGEPIRYLTGKGSDSLLQRAPMWGEDNEPILRDLLGLSQTEFDALVAGKVIY